MVEGRGVEHGRARARAELEHGSRERACGQQDGGAAREIEQDRHHEVMRHREEPEDAIVGSDREAPVRGFETREDRRVPEDDALAPVRRARREPQVGGP